MKMNDCGIDTIQRERLYETFRFLVDFLNCKNLRWFCAYGTALGAVRHKDLIPWDDDIDIYMPREDYEKLLGMQKEFKRMHYEIISLNNYGYYYTFGKIVDKNSTLIESSEYLFPLGVYIDIFPMDLTSDTVETFSFKYSILRKALKKYQFSLDQTPVFVMRNYLVERRFGELYWALRHRFYRFNKNKYYKDLLEKEKIFLDNSGDNLIAVSWTYGSKDIVKKEWFSGYKEAVFHDFKVRVPIGVEEYLTHMYGDYMQLPPEEKRVAHHKRFYFNLKNRVTIEEALIDVKKGLSVIY